MYQMLHLGMESKSLYVKIHPKKKSTALLSISFPSTVCLWMLGIFVPHLSFAFVIRHYCKHKGDYIKLSVQL